MRGAQKPAAADPATTGGSFEITRGDHEDDVVLSGDGVERLRDERVRPRVRRPAGEAEVDDPDIAVRLGAN
jgi:hypothetical protein